MVEWLKNRADDQQCLGSKPTCVILLCSWERHFTALSSALWSWQAVLNYSNISIKLQEDSNIFASPEAGWGNCLPYLWRLHRFPASQEDKYRDKIKNSEVFHNFKTTGARMLILVSKDAEDISFYMT